MIRRRLIITFLFPALALYIGFMIYPAILAVKLSFYETSGFGSEQVWVGLNNYKRLMSDPVFWQSLSNTLLILVVGGMGVFGFAFLFSVFLNSGIWGKKFFRAIIFMPNAVAVIAISAFWSFMYTPRYGLLPNFFGALEDAGLPTFGLSKVLWTSPENIFFAMMIGLIWVGTGFFTILILAGVDKIPAEMMEAGRIEGASDFQIFRYITLPMISDVVLITIVLWSVQAIKVFEYPYAFGGPNIDPALYTNAIYLYIQGFGQRDPIFALGYATALGVVMVLLTILIVIFFRFFKPAEQLEF